MDRLQNSPNLNKQRQDLKLAQDPRQTVEFTIHRAHECHQKVDSSADVYVMREPRPCALSPMPAMCCTEVSYKDPQMRWCRRVESVRRRIR
jgi:hypothetical protein